MTSPTILFVPGAWHGTEAFDEVRQELSARGYPSSAVPLVSVGSKDATVGVAEDAAEIRAELERLIGAGADVIIVTHSYGGVPGSNAVQGLNKKDRAARGEKGGVLMVVYLASFAIAAGTSLMDGIGGKPLPWWDVNDGFVLPLTPGDVFYGDVEPSLGAKAAAALLPEPMGIFTGKSGFEPWKHGFGVGYIFAEDDRAIPLQAQQGMASQFPEGSFTASLASSHSPFLSMPKELSEAIAGAAKHAASG